MPDAAAEFAALSYALREAGERGLKRELDKALNDAAEPVTKIIANVDHLKDFMPDRYAAVLSPDLRVRVSKRSTGDEPGVAIVASAPTAGGPPSSRGRAVRRLNRGLLGHPLFGQRAAGNPRQWSAWFYQADGVAAGFFDKPVNQARPEVRRQIEAALARVRDEIYAAR